MASSKHPAFVLALCVAVGGALAVLWHPDEVEVDAHERWDHAHHGTSIPDCSCVHDEGAPRGAAKTVDAPSRDDAAPLRSKAHD